MAETDKNRRSVRIEDNSVCIANTVGGLGDDEGRRYERPGTVDRLHAPVVIGVGVVGSCEKDARVDDEQASVSAEAVGKKLIGFARKAAGAGRPEPNERERLLHGHGFGRQRGGQLGDHEVDADPASCRLGLQTCESVLGKINRDGHEPSIGAASWEEVTSPGVGSRVNPSDL